MHIYFGGCYGIKIYFPISSISSLSMQKKDNHNRCATRTLRATTMYEKSDLKAMIVLVK